MEEYRSGYRILVADDDENVHRSLNTYFKREGYQLLSAYDGEQALAEEVSMEAIITADPDYIFVTTMGNDEEAALKSIQELLADHPAWKNLTAIKENHYYVLPQNLFHNKPNHRWAESYEILADILYPESKDED